MKPSATAIVRGTLIRSFAVEQPTERLEKKRIVILTDAKRDSQVQVELLNDNISKFLHLLKKDAGLELECYVNGRLHTNKNTGDEMWFTSFVVQNIKEVELDAESSEGVSVEDDVEF